MLTWAGLGRCYFLELLRITRFRMSLFLNNIEMPLVTNFTEGFVSIEKDMK